MPKDDRVAVHITSDTEWMKNVIDSMPNLPTEPEYCGVYWIITTCLTGIALGIGFGGLLWLVLS